MARSTDINTYSAPERALLSNEYLDSLPRSLRGFPTRRAAMSARLAIYGLIGAGKRSPNLGERNNALSLGISNPIEEPNGTWTLNLFDKNATHIGELTGSSALAAITADVLDACGGSLPLPPSTPPVADEGGLGVQSLIADPASPNAKWSSAAGATVDALAKLGYADRPAAPAEAPADAGGLGAKPGAQPPIPELSDEALAAILQKTQEKKQ